MWTCRIQPRRTPLQNQTIRLYPVRSHDLFILLIPNYQTTMKTVKNINANGTMSNLVGLWAVIRNEEGKIKNTVFIYGKADDEHFLVQAVSALSGEPNVIRIVHLRDMIEWVFYADSELLGEEHDQEARQGSVRYKLEIPRMNVDVEARRK